VKAIKEVGEELARQDPRLCIRMVEEGQAEGEE
jgi:hypothetical protein